MAGNRSWFSTSRRSQRKPIRWDPAQMAISRWTRPRSNRNLELNNKNHACQDINVMRKAFRSSILMVLLAFTAIVGAQNSGQRITPNFKDAEIGQVIEAVAAATGKTIIPDSRVRAQVTMLSQTP